MEVSSPEFKLLEESIKLSNVAWKPSTDQLSDWVICETTKPTDHFGSANHLPQGKKDFPKRPEQSFSSSGDVNKGLRTPYRRVSPGVSRSRSRDHLNVKFEHFARSSQFIEEYRTAKQLRLEETFDKLMSHERKTSKYHQGNVMEKHSSSKAGTTVTDTCASSSSCPELGQQQRRGLQYDDSVKPSLPQSGSFTGKKWVYTRELGSQISASGSKYYGSRFKIKKPELQVFNVRNMCLKGTGKPLNNVIDKTWTVPRTRTVCKSAPINRQRPRKKVLSPNLKLHSAESTPTVSQNFTDFNSLIEARNPTTSLPKSQDSFEHLRKDEKAKACHGQENSHQNLEYENIFKDVIDFYEHRKHSGRSQVFVRIGT